MIKSYEKLRKQNKDKIKVPKRAQDVIDIDTIYKDGIFCSGNKYSKTYCFKDVNYSIASKEEKVKAEDKIMQLTNYIMCLPDGFNTFCEIDIIAKQKDTLVFVEVKTRKNNDFGAPLEAITQTKLNNIKTGVFSYLQSASHKYKNFRIDVIGITLQPALKIDHLKSI